MWRITTLVTIPKLTEAGVEYIARPFVLQFPAGRIPSRAVIQQAAFAQARDFFNMIADTVGSRRPYEYGDPAGMTIVSVEFIR